MPRMLSFPLLALLPALVVAQVDLPTDTAVGNSFRAFEVRMLAESIRPEAAAPLSEYALVWVEHNNGYFTSVAPGDSSVTLLSMVPSGRMTYPGAMDDVTFHGERFAVRVRDIPVGMLDLTRWFFERGKE